MTHRHPILCSAAAALAFSLAALAPATAGAAAVSPGAGGAVQTRAGNVSFTLGASVGQIEGTATELVYDHSVVENFKVSELTWDIKEVLMAGLHGSVAFGGRFRVNLGYWTALNEGNAEMIDRDWMYSPSGMLQIDPNADNWTHESRHPDTSLDKGTMLDLNLTGRIWQSGPFSVSGILGYKSDNWKWSARGGSYIYSVDGFRDTVGRFQDGKEVIVYEQEYAIPYLGIGAGWSGGSFAVDGRVLVSNLVSANDTDDHVLRSTIFKGEFEGGTFVGVGVGASWQFAPRWCATAGLDYQKLSDLTGDVDFDSPQGDTTFEDGGGVAQDAVLLSLGARFVF